MIDLDTLRLSAGSHASRDNGMCLLEAVAWVAGEPHSDHPECVCPVLAAFGRSWNDALGDEDRDRLLRPLIPKLIGTRSTPDVEVRRAWMALDWMVRTFTPAWLRLAGLTVQADTLAGLPELTTADAARAYLPMIDAAWAAARDAAWDAARAAARDAARAAAGAAAWAAAWAAARAAARAALAPTVTELQASALDLADRMIGCRA